MKIKKLNKLIIILILLFYFLMQVWDLGKNPTGLFCDEALRGVDAYSILKTGRDTNGDFLPLFLKGFDHDPIGPYFAYLPIPFIKVFGMNEMAVRLPGIIISTLGLLIFYLLLKKFLPQIFAVLGTFFLAISPWYIHISRTNMADMYVWPFLISLAYLFFIKAGKTNKYKFYYYTSLSFGLAMYTYIPSRLITPILFGLAIFQLIITRKFKQLLLMILVYLIVSIPFIIYYTTDSYSLKRLQDTSDLGKTQDKKSTLLNQTFIKGVAGKYFLHYSDDFLFTKGDADYPGQFITRHSISGLGLLFPYQRILLLSGLILIIYLIIKGRTELLFIIYLFLLFPLADSLTNNPTPYATRSYLGVLPLNIIVIFGLFGIYKIFKKLGLWKIRILKVSITTFFVFFLLESVVSLTINLKNNPLTTSDFWGWQYGPREIIGYFTKVENDYDELIMEPVFNAPHIFFKFYAPDSCQNCILGNLANYDSSKKQLFALSKNYLDQNPLANYKTVKTIYYPNMEVAFKLIEVKQ